MGKVIWLGKKGCLSEDEVFSIFECDCGAVAKLEGFERALVCGCGKRMTFLGHITDRTE